MTRPIFINISLILSVKKSFSGDLLIPSVVTSFGGVTYLSMLRARQPS